jgi:pentatricopeptide repeat protein
VLFITGVGEPMAEHRVYVSAVGFFLACGAMAGMAWARATQFGRGTLALAAIGAVFVAQLAGLTLIRNAVWGSPVALATEAVALSPDHWVPRLLLGETLRQHGRCGDAVPQYRAVIAQQGLETFTYKKLVSCLIETGQMPEAEQALHEMRTMDPRSQEAALGLGLLAAARGHTDESRQYFNEIIARDPRHREAQQFVALLDGSLAEPERRSLCGAVRALAHTAPGAAAPPGSPCP